MMHREPGRSLAAVDSAARLDRHPPDGLSMSALADLLPDETLRPLRWSDVERLIELGAFDDDERFELLEGVLVVVYPEGPPHAWGVQQLNRILSRGLPDGLSVRVGNAWIASDISVPGPDLAVVPDEYYGDRHPSTALLILEVSQTSLRKDRGIKARIYAEAGVPEYWVVDVAGGVVHVHSDPLDGRYRTITVHGRGAILEAVGVPVPVDDVLPRP
jgi:Uma2 family endonuclease